MLKPRAATDLSPRRQPLQSPDLPLTRSALDGERYTNVELVIVWPDGQQRDLLVNTASIQDRRGEIAGAVGVFRDITQRKRMEETVRRYADRLRVLHEIDKAVLAAQTAEEIANATLHHLHKLVPYQLAGVELFDLEVGEASVLSVRAEGEPSLENGRRHRLVWYEPIEALREGCLYIVEDIRTVPANPLVEALQDEGLRSFVSVPLIVQGELIGCLSFARDELGGLTRDELEVVRDLADELAIGIHQARLHRQVQEHAEELEQRVAARTAQLRASEARFRAIFEQSALGIALLDKKGRVIASNPALQGMLGRSSEELAGELFARFAQPDEETTADVMTYREMATGEQDYYRAETQYIDADDEARCANLVLSLVRSPAGEPRFAIAVVEDITERKRAQAALVQSEKLAMTGRLAASLAHGVNNPLQTVIGCLGLAEESLALDDRDELGQYITMAHEELRRAARIVSRLRDLSRPTDVDAGEPTDVNGLIDRVLKLSRKELESRRIEAVRHLAENLPQPVLVPDRMQQVFLNLVLNAVDAMPEGGAAEGEHQPGRGVLDAREGSKWQDDVKARSSW